MYKIYIFMQCAPGPYPMTAHIRPWLSKCLSLGYGVRVRRRADPGSVVDSSGAIQLESELREIRRNLTRDHAESLGKEAMRFTSQHAKCALY
eukprot:COSAG05_NODE_147_length_16383_cov_266.102555_8_plen_92_part_00